MKELTFNGIVIRRCPICGEYPDYEIKPTKLNKAHKVGAKYEVEWTGRYYYLGEIVCKEHIYRSLETEGKSMYKDQFTIIEGLVRLWNGEVRRIEKKLCGKIKIYDI